MYADVRPHLARIIPAYHHFLQRQSLSDEEGLTTKRNDLLAHLKDFTKAMDPTGPFFAGSSPSLVEFTLAPWAMRMWVFDKYKGGLGIPAPGEGSEVDEEVWGSWWKWVQIMEERPSLKGPMSEREHYLSIYQRYADDTAQSEAAKAVRAGKGIP